MRPLPVFLRLFTFSVCLVFASPLFSQVTVNTGFTAQQLVDQFVGQGIEVVPGSEQYLNGNIQQFGAFQTNGGATAIGIDQGIILSTGNAIDVNNADTSDFLSNDFGFPFADSDPDLAALEPNGNTINDAAVLRFEFVPQSDEVTFNYIFASEEYEEFAPRCNDINGSNFNDIFGFYISGPKVGGVYSIKTNIARVPNDITVPTFTATEVSIATINILTNSQYYISNTDDYVAACPADPHGVTIPDFGFNGYSVLLPAQAAVTPCDTYLLELKLGDVFDEIYDTGVLLEAGSFSAPVVEAISDSVDNDGNAIYYEGCTSDSSYFRVIRPSTATGSVDLDIFYGGTATPGVDYQALPSTVNFPAGIDTVEVPFLPIFDGVQESPPDTLEVRIPIPECDTTGTPDSIKINLVIIDIDTLDTDLPDTLKLCEGDPVNFSPTITGGLAENKDHTWFLDGVEISDTNTVSIASLDTTSILTFEITDTCSTPDYSKDVVLYIGLYDDSVNVETKDLRCFDEGDGEIRITVGGDDFESGPLEFSIDGGTTYQSDGDFVDLDAGNYSIVVQDSNGCTTTPIPITLQEPPALDLVLDLEKDIRCNGDNDGIIEVSATGGTPAYEFSNDGGSSFGANGDFNNLAPGTYNMEVRDDSLCTDTFSVEITEAPLLTGSLKSQKGETCFGANDGEIAITADGGTLPLNFSVDNGATFQPDSNFTNLSPGNYDVVIEDDSGCVVGPIAVAIDAAAELLIDNIDVTDVDCQGSLTGEIDITASGGAPPIEYSIDGGTTYDSNPLFTGLADGSYQVQIIDDSSCVVGPVAVTIDEPSSLVLSVDDTEDESCFNNADGEIELSAVGGTAPLEFSVDGGTTYQSSGTFTSLPAGNYQVQVRDDEGCIDGPQSVDIIAAPVFTGDTLFTKSIKCFGDDDGIIRFTANGGTAPVEFSIDGGTTWSTDSLYTNLTPGSYNVEIRDDNSCTIDPGVVSIDEPAEFLIDNIATTDLLCENDSIGEIVITLSGGSAPFEYSIDGGTTLQSSNTFSDLDGGSYSVYAVDDSGCTVGPDPVTLDEPTEVILSLDASTDLTCSNSDDGTITLSASGGTVALPSDYEFSIDSGATWQTSGNFTNLTDQWYYLFARDDRGCVSAVDSVEIVPAIVVTGAIDSAKNLQCYNTTDGLIFTAGSGGTPPYQYSIDGGSNYFPTPNFTTLDSGSYSVVIRDDNGCESNAIDTTLLQPDTLRAVMIDSSSVTCNGDDNGRILMTGSGGIPFDAPLYAYSIDNGATFSPTDSLFENLKPGTYNLVVRDDSNCVSEPSAVEILEPDPLNISLDFKKDLRCFAEDDGEIQIASSGGWGGIEFSIDGGSNFGADSLFTNLTPGTYNTVVEDDSGCADSLSVDILEPTELQASVLEEDVSCNGADDGRIAIDATGGSPAYAFSIDNGANFVAGDEFTNLSPGIYNVVVEDDSACQTTAIVVEITELPALTLDIVDTSSLSCNGINDGLIEFEGTGGAVPYEYSIDNGTTYASGNLFNNLPAGTYDLVVRDDSGCVATQTIELIEPNAFVADTASSTDILCNGDATGDIQFAANGGAKPYSFSIDNGVTFQADSLFENLNAGSYNLIAEDDNGCTVNVGTVTLTEPTALTVGVPVATNITCFGDDDGEIEIVSAAGGVPPYEYSIDGGTNWVASNTFTNLTPGSYNQLKVRDDNGCEIFASTTTIDEPGELVLSIDVADDISCNGLTDGEIELSATGGTLPYNFSIDGGANFQTGGLFQNLTADTYDLVVEDDNGCTDTDVQALIEPAAVNLDDTTFVNPSCNGALNGSIEILVSGGVPPYEYTVNNGSTWLPNNTVTGLPADTYTISARDDNQCEIVGGSFNFTLVDPSAVTIAIDSSFDISCNGGSDGRIYFSASGGTPPYEYSADGGTTYQATGEFLNLPAGQHDLIARDANGCESIVINAVLSDPSVVTAATVSVKDISCFGADDGWIIFDSLAANVGGTPDYEFSIDNGSTWQSSATFTGLTPDNYIGLVRDTNGCISGNLLDLQITEPAELNLTLVDSANVTCFNEANGFVQIDGTGGSPDPVTGNYEYSRDNGANWANDGFFSNLDVGTYQFLVRDDSGCIAPAVPLEITITQPTQLQPAAALKTERCLDEENGEIALIISGGVPGYEFSIDSGATYVQDSIFPNLAPGFYDAFIRDTNGCRSDIQTLQILEADSLSVSAVDIDSITCNGDNNGGMTLEANGGWPDYVFSLDNGLSFNNETEYENLLPGTYNVVARDDSLCVSAPIQVVVPEPDPVTVSLDSKSDISCNGANDGSITVIGNGGWGDYEYSIDNGVTWQTGTGFTALSPGLYQIIARDDSLCTSSPLAITINEPTVLSISLVSATDATCPLNSDGSLEVVANGGTAPFEFSIDGGANYQTSGVFSGLGVGSYDVQVRDANGCVSSSIAVNIGDQAGLSANLVDSTNVTCNGEDDGTIFVGASGNNPPLTFNLTGTVNRSENVGTFTGLPAGDYTVVVTDVNGCETNPISVTLTAPAPITYTIDSILPASCDDTDPSNDDGGIFLTASGGTGDLTYRLDGFFVDDGNIQNLSPGQHVVEIIDENGCTVQLPTDSSFIGTLPPLTYTYDVLEEACFGDNDGAIKVYTTDGVRPFYFEASGPETVGGQNSFLQDLVPGDYTLTVADVCTTFTETVNVPEGILLEAAFETSPPMPATDTLPNAEVAFLNLTNVTYDRPALPLKFFWDFGDGYTSADSAPMPHDYLETGEYQISLVANKGECWDTVMAPGTFTVGLETIEVSNVITPNGDGINDEWVVGSENFLSVNVTIYDRYGTLHFNQDGSTVIWRPTPETPAGVYFYTLTYIDGSGTRQRMTGNLTVLR